MSKSCDASGVASLSTDGINHIASATISKILNKQFTSVCTAEDTPSILKLTPNDQTDVKSILVNRKGVLKLLKDINPNKATGPDAFLGILLNALCDEVVDSTTHSVWCFTQVYDIVNESVYQVYSKFGIQNSEFRIRNS